MYAITYNNNVFLTPVSWNPRYIMNVINSDYDIRVSLLPSDEQRIPFDITDNIRILPVVEVKPEINSLTQMYMSNTWDITENLATATYQVSYQPLDLVRQRVKEKVASKRYDKETSGVKVTIQEQEITVETDRDTRNLFVQAFLLMGDTDVRGWKFPEGFLQVTKSDMGMIVSTGLAFVQSTFDWESTFVTEINSADYARLSEIYDSLDEVTQPLV